MNLPCFGTDSSRSGKPESVTTIRNHVHHLLWALVIHEKFGFKVRPNDDAGAGMDQWLEG